MYTYSRYLIIKRLFGQINRRFIFAPVKRYANAVARVVALGQPCKNRANMGG